MDIQTTKIDLIQWLTTIEDSTVIKKISEIRNSQKEDWWDTIDDSEKRSIEMGILDVESGQLKPQSEAKKIYEKWL